MKALLAARADQRLSGLIKSYVELHLSQCAQCRAALESLIALRERLIALRSAPIETETLSPDRQKRVQAAFSELLQRHNKSG
jgi:predicted anti-sigma-YlaC factor YlaD